LPRPTDPAEAVDAAALESLRELGNEDFLGEPIEGFRD
jgi:hypothetical protein